jgi:beta-phosphoglucomutase-like phosphatase (HAD superfamily)
VQDRQEGRGVTVRDRAATRVVIFDFDGTIVDSMAFLTELAAGLLSTNYGMDLNRARRAYIDTTGLPFVKQMEIIAPGDSRNPATVGTFEARKRESLLDFDFFPDAPGAVERIRKNGIKACVSSGNYEELIAEILALKGLEVDLVMGFRPGFEKGVDHFRFAMETFGATAEEMVFVGDSKKDGIAAQSAGVRFIARAGLLSAEEFAEALPGVPVIASLDEMIPMLGIE